MAIIPPLSIVITARNEASAAINDVANSAASMGQSVSAAGNAIEAAQKKTAKLREELENARAGGAALEEIARRAQDLDDHLNSAAGRAGQLQDGFEKIRTASLAVGAASVGGLMLANSFIQAAEEGNAVEQRLESILKAQQRLNDLGTINAAIEDVTVKGHFSDDDADGIKNAAIHLASFGAETEAIGELLPRVARQVRTGFGTFESVADGMGKAIANFDLGPLSESGLLFSEQEKAAAKAAKELGGVAGQLKIVEILTAAVDRNTVSLEDSLTGAQAAANDASRAMGDLEEAVGTGAGRGKEKVDNLTSSLLGAVNANKEFAEGAGQILYIGSAFGTGAASVVGFIAQVGLAKLALQQMGITGTGAWLSTARAAGVARLATIRATVATVAARGAGVGLAGLGGAATLGPVAVGVGVGLAGAEIIRRRQVANGDKLAPGSFGEMLGNTWAKISGGEVTEQDGLTATQRREKMAAVNAENAAKADAAKAQRALGEMQSGLAGALTTGDDSATIDSEAAASTSKGKGSAKSAANAMAKAFKAAQRTREKEAKDNARALGKLQDSQIKAADETAKAQADIAIAQIEADFDVRRAQIEASIEGGDDKATARANYQIAQMEAAKTQRVAAIKADGMKGVDELGRNTSLKISGIETARKLTLAGMALKRALSKDDDSERDNGPSNALSAALAAGRLKGSYSGGGSGGGPFGMRSGNYGSDAPAFVGSDPRAMAAGIEAARGSFGSYGRGDGYENRNSPGVGSGGSLTASVQSMVRDALGNIVVQFAPVTITDNDSMMSAARLLAN